MFTRKLESHRHIVFLGCIATVTFVALVDTHMTIRYQDSLAEMERNPLALWLIMLDGGSADLFVHCKILGTVLTVGVLQLVYVTRRRLGLVIGAAIAAVQAFVLVYLFAADGRTGFSLFAQIAWAFD